MNLWFVNENVRSVNKKRMPTLKRKHADLRWTASCPGQKKLAFKERQLKQRFLLIRFTALGYWNEEHMIKSLGFLEFVVHLFEETLNFVTLRYIGTFNRLWHNIQYQILLFLGRSVIFDTWPQSSILAKFLSCNNMRK